MRGRGWLRPDKKTSLPAAAPGFFILCGQPGIRKLHLSGWPAGRWSSGELRRRAWL